MLIEYTFVILPSENQKCLCPFLKRKHALNVLATLTASSMS